MPKSNKEIIAEFANLDVAFQKALEKMGINRDDLPDGGTMSVIYDKVQMKLETALLEEFKGLGDLEDDARMVATTMLSSISSAIFNINNGYKSIQNAIQSDSGANSNIPILLQNIIHSVKGMIIEIESGADEYKKLKIQAQIERNEHAALVDEVCQPASKNTQDKNAAVVASVKKQLKPTGSKR